MNESLLDCGIVCLVCLCSKETSNSIFNDDPDNPGMQIYEKIASCSNLNIPKNLLEKVPNKICSPCMRELATTWRFRKKCDTASRLFQMMLAPETEAETIVKKTLNEHQIKLPPGIKVKCVNSQTNMFAAKKEPMTKFDAMTEMEKQNVIVDQENLPLPTEMPLPSLLTQTPIRKPVSSSPLQTKMKNESQMNPVSLMLGLPHVNAVDVGVGNDLDFVDIPSVNEFISIDEMLVHEDSVGDQNIEYIYDSEFFDNSHDDLTVLMSPSRLDNSKELPLYAKESSFPDSTSNGNDEIMQQQRTQSDNNSAALRMSSATFQMAQNVGKTGATRLPSLPSSTSSSPSSGSSAAQRTKTRGRAASKAPAKVCDLCGNVYKYQHALIAHMRRHSNEKPFPCEVCKKAFVSNVELRRHMRVHTGQKPYACQFCTRRFSDFGSSKKHERIHTGERPYVCVVCDKRFAYAHVLSEHKRTHTGEKKFSCVHCGVGFTKKIYLETHEKVKCKKNSTKTICHNNNSNSKDNNNNNHELLTNDCFDIDEFTTGLHDDTDIDILHGTSVDIDENCMPNVFEDNVVLEECIVETEFMSDSLDGIGLPDVDCLNHDDMMRDDETDEGGADVLPSVIKK